MPSTPEIASGTDDGDLLRSVLHVPRSAGVTEPGELVGVAELLDGRRELLEEVAHAAHERNEQQEHERRDGERSPDDGDGRREPARHARLRHHEANRVLEDEREEDADEDDEERVADRGECDGEAERAATSSNVRIG